MAKSREGKRGVYFGSLFSESEILTETEMRVNANYIYSELSNAGWTANSISAILGNLQAESSINPGRWQGDNVGNYDNGYGLVQWTPATNYTDWCLGQGFNDPSEMDANLSRILYEVENGLQWIPTNSYNFSFADFTASSESVSNLAKAFLLNYERPKDQSDEVQNYRSSLAEAWYTYLTGTAPIDTDIPITKAKKSKYNFLLFNAKRRNAKWKGKHF